MRKYIISLLILFIAVPGFTQSVAQAGSLKLFPSLFAQAKDVPGVTWSPEWPADLPPDAFLVHAGAVGSIDVVAELMTAPSESTYTETGKMEKAGTTIPAEPKPAIAKPAAPKAAPTVKPAAAEAQGATANGATTIGADGNGTLEVKYSVGLAGFEFPVFSGGAAYSLRFGLDASGKIRSFTMSKVAEDAGKEPGEGTGKKTGDTAGNVEADTTKISLEYDPSGILFRTTIETGGDTSFSTFSVREALVEELVYDAEGLALGRFVYRRGREGVRSLEQVGEDGVPGLLMGFEYDAGGRLSAVGSEKGTTEVLYDALARPVSIRTVAAGNAASERRLQWDERGFLVCETLRDQDGKTMEFRYDYVFDIYGNWTERRSLVYTERMGAYIPQNGPTVTRKIIYR